MSDSGVEQSSCSIDQWTIDFEYNEELQCFDQKPCLKKTLTYANDPTSVIRGLLYCTKECVHQLTTDGKIIQVTQVRKVSEKLCEVIEMITDLTTDEAMKIYLDETFLPKLIEFTQIVASSSQVEEITMSHSLRIFNATKALVKEYLKILRVPVMSRFKEEFNRIFMEKVRQEKLAAKSIQRSPESSADTESVLIVEDKSRPSKKGIFKTQNLQKSVKEQRPLYGKRKMAFTIHSDVRIIRGVVLLGLGKWKQILNKYTFPAYRTSVHLKDRWRNMGNQKIVRIAEDGELILSTAHKIAYQHFVRDEGKQRKERTPTIRLRRKSSLSSTSTTSDLGPPQLASGGLREECHNKSSSSATVDEFKSKLISLKKQVNCDEGSREPVIVRDLLLGLLEQAQAADEGGASSEESANEAESAETEEMISISEIDSDQESQSEVDATGGRAKSRSDLREDPLRIRHETTVNDVASQSHSVASKQTLREQVDVTILERTVSSSPSKTKAVDTSSPIQRRLNGQSGSVPKPRVQSRFAVAPGKSPPTRASTCANRDVANSAVPSGHGIPRSTRQQKDTDETAAPLSENKNNEGEDCELLSPAKSRSQSPEGSMSPARRRRRNTARGNSIARVEGQHNVKRKRRLWLDDGTGEVMTWETDPKHNFVSREKASDIFDTVQAKKLRTHKKKPWTDWEEENLNKGIKRFGKGQWSMILDNYKFNNRTTIMLKDKHRTLNRQKEQMRKKVDST